MQQPGNPAPERFNRQDKLLELCELYERETAEACELDAEFGELALPEVNLQSLLGEITSLKAELRKQTQASRELCDAVQLTADPLKLELERAAARERSLREESAARSRQASRQAARALIDIADRLEATLVHVRELARPRYHWFRKRPDPAAVSLLEGLELTQLKLADNLRYFEAERMTTKLQRFDPQWMEAVDSVERSDLENGLVVEEITAGYRDSAGPLRIAQVVVNRIS